MCRVPIAAAVSTFTPPAWLDAAVLPPYLPLAAAVDALLPPMDAEDLSMLDAFLKTEPGVKSEAVPGAGSAMPDGLLASSGLAALDAPLTHAVAVSGGTYAPRGKGKKVGSGWAGRWCRGRERGAGRARALLCACRPPPKRVVGVRANREAWRPRPETGGRARKRHSAGKGPSVCGRPRPPRPAPPHRLLKRSRHKSNTSRRGAGRAAGARGGGWRVVPLRDNCTPTARRPTPNPTSAASRPSAPARARRGL